MKTRKPTDDKAATYFLVEQGMPSPRDGTIGYRPFDAFKTEDQAMREARKLPYARVTRCTILAVIEQRPAPTPTRLH